MPINKNASFRYRVIDRCLRNQGRPWTIDDLVDEISDELWEQFGIDKGVGKRTVEGDISLMRSDPPRGFAAPIICKNKKYYYNDLGYSITDHPLVNEDIDNLRYAIDIMKQFRGLPNFRDLEQIIYKIEGQVNTTGMREVIRFEAIGEAVGLKWLEILYKACLGRTVLRITYQSFKSPEPKVEIVHPYLLKEYRNRWFLLGYNETLDFISIYGLERIQKIKESNRKFNYEKANEIKGIHDSVIGVSVPNGKEACEIIFDAIPSQAKYLVTKPFHASLEIVEEGKRSTRFRVKLIANFELEQLLLSFGENITIIAPPEFRNRIRERLEKAITSY